MISNIPAFAVHQDYQARHSDMLAAARRGKDAEVVLRSGWSSWNQRPGVTFNGQTIRWIGLDFASSQQNRQP